jgi:hypothetical protein
LLVFDKASDVEQFLMNFKVMRWHSFLSLDPAIVQIGSLVMLIGSLVFNDLFQFLEELELLYHRICSIVRLSEQRSDPLVQEIPRIVDLLERALVILNLDQVHSRVEILLIQVKLCIQIRRILLHVVPSAQVPCSIHRIRHCLLHNLLDLLLVLLILLLLASVPHLLHQSRQLLPISQVAIASQFTPLHLYIIISSDSLFLIDLQGFRPLLQLLIPVFFLMDEQVLLGILKDSFGCLRLLQLIVSLNQQFDCVLGVILKLLLPVVQCLRIGITFLGYLGQRLTRK